MKTCWTAGLTKEKAEEIRQDFNSSGVLRERLDEIIAKKIASSNRDRTLKNTYDSPNWAYIQADSIGYERALEEIRSILK